MRETLWETVTNYWNLKEGLEFPLGGECHSAKGSSRQIDDKEDWGKMQ